MILIHAAHHQKSFSKGEPVRGRRGLEWCEEILILILALPFSSSVM